MVISAIIGASKAIISLIPEGKSPKSLSSSVPIEAKPTSKGLRASKECVAQPALVTGSIVKDPLREGVKPVTLLTCSSATLKRFSNSIRSTGSTLGSLVPPEAIAIAICLADCPPCCEKDLNISFKNDISENGLSSSGLDGSKNSTLAS